MVYLDYAATGVMLPEVVEAMREAELEFFANPSALHTPAHLAMNEIEKVREKLAKMINAEPEEIIFTSGATESNNTVIRTFERHEIETSPLEHHSILETAKIFRGEKKPKLYSYMFANNETGELLDIKTLIEKAHTEGGYFHSDLTQAFGKVPIDVKELGLDYATISAHKIGGPVGIGALYVKKGALFKPLLVGGNQEKGRRGGTYNTAAIIGLGAAIDEIFKKRASSEYDTRVRALRDELARRILEEVKGSSLNTDLSPDKSLPNILNVSFRAAEGEAIQLYLDAEGIIVSTGSACAAGDGKPSHVLMAKTGDAEIAHSSIRFSFGVSNTKDDVEKVMEVLPGIIDKLQKMSTIEV
ncbi:MAG: cysteine desulfurase family protein [Candidatus Saccharibacteria bacterium]|nr:cysteine desulfurase family protein [Candidatus Saccharibacteria bacterium]